ncbi:MAG: response regulator [Gammaproteobacteria bacterium]|nr:response regulator [Gammaproteobacteria bacterium]
MDYNNRILIIDDDKCILDIFSSVLTNADSPSKSENLAQLSKLMEKDTVSRQKRVRCFEVDTAQQGEEGFNKVRLSLAEGKPYSVIFTDMRMPPGWDGAKTAQEIRKIDPQVEIIVVTAYSDTSIAQIVKQVRFTDRLLYLKKPFDDEEILQLSDSLSMRWNLETKVQGMVSALETMIDRCYELNLTQYQEDSIYPFLKQAIEHVSNFLETKDVLIVRVENGRIVLKVGLGCFEKEYMGKNNFDNILSELVDKVPMTRILQTSIFTVLPMSGQRWNGFMVGLSSQFQIEGTSKLLGILALNITKLFDIISMVTNLQESSHRKDKEIKALQEQLKQYEENSKKTKVK